MIALYIDTSSNFLYIAILKDNKLIKETKKELVTNLSDIALLEINELLIEANYSTKEIEKIYVVTGPGSFTGIRIGVTIAKVLAWSLKINVTEISSLKAMAISNDMGGYNYYIPMIDARRESYYAAIYDKNYQIVLEEQYIHKKELLLHLDKLKENKIIITNDKIDINIKSINYDPNIEKIAMLSANNKEINPHVLDAKYLKLTEAEEKLND